MPPPQRQSAAPGAPATASVDGRGRSTRHGGSPRVLPMLPRAPLMPNGLCGLRPVGLPGSPVLSRRPARTIHASKRGRSDAGATSLAIVDAVGHRRDHGSRFSRSARRRARDIPPRRDVRFGHPPFIAEQSDRSTGRSQEIRRRTQRPGAYRRVIALARSAPPNMSLRTGFVTCSTISQRAFPAPPSRRSESAIGRSRRAPRR